MKRPIVVGLGLILAVAGALALAVGGIPYTEEEQVVDVGPIQASSEVEKELDIPPLVGGLILAAGAGLVVYGSMRGR